MSRIAFFNQEGVTLLEMLISVALVGVLFIAFTSLQTTALRTWTSGDTAVSQQSSVRKAMDRFLKDVRQARRIVDAQPAEITLYSPAGREIRYYLAGTDLIREEEGSTPQAVAQGIASLQFEYTPDRHEVTATITTVSQSQQSFSLRGKATLRSPS